MTGLKELERRDLARRHLDAAEMWLRRIIDVKLSAAFGAAYLTIDPAGTCPSISKSIRRQINGRYESQRARFPRVIDASDLSDTITIVLHPDLYANYFRDSLVAAFPDGPAEARTYLSRLEEIRNKLAHGGACSERDLERAVCYSNDLTDSIKQHFKEQNMERQFNVPTFVRVTDNKGNDFHLTPGPNDQVQYLDVRARGNGDLYVGEELLLEVEVDPNFTDWSIELLTFNGERGFGPLLKMTIGLHHVGLDMIVRFQLKSSEQWHRLHGGYDDILELHYRVLPPGN